MVALAVAVFAAALFSAGFALGANDEGRGGSTTFLTGSGGQALGFDAVEDAYEAITSGAVDPPDEAALSRAAIKGMVEELKKSNDPYALFFNRQSYRSLQELTTGRFTGIGVWLKTKGDEALTIVSVLPDTPALEAGLRAGDVIREVDGESLDGVNSDEAVGMIKGPDGSEVTLEVERAGDLLSFTMTRAEIELPNLEAEMRGGDIGYVRLFGFARQAGAQLRREVQSLLDRGATGIVLDLRDNGGGLFTEGVEVASVFIDEGDVVTYRDADEGDTDYEVTGNAVREVPLVVLVNEGTASASEIVAGALQDHDRAILIGATTYGKGSVQEVVRLPDDSAMKFTTAAYLTPDGRNINGQGITPDVKVKFDPDSNTDAQLRRALSELRERAGGG